jgi:hypothetical protein
LSAKNDTPSSLSSITCKQNINKRKKQNTTSYYELPTHKLK